MYKRQGENVLLIVGDLAACYYLLGDCANAEPAAREALALATRFRHQIQKLFALSYIAAVSGERNASEAARLIGYAEEGLRRAGWTRVSYDRAVVDRLEHKLKQQLTETEPVSYTHLDVYKRQLLRRFRTSIFVLLSKPPSAFRRRRETIKRCV